MYKVCNYSVHLDNAGGLHHKHCDVHCTMSSCYIAMYVYLNSTTETHFSMVQSSTVV